MKNKLIIVFILMNCFSGYGQNHCSFNVNTPLGSTVNVFDWTQEQYSGIYLNSDGTNSVEIFPYSPFHFNDQDRNIDHLKGPIIKDYHPEDGWELLFTKFGTAGVGQNGVTVPAFVLYNRYESLMRAFFIYLKVLQRRRVMIMLN